MRVTAFGPRDSPDRQIQIDLFPAHRENIRLPGTSEQAQVDIVTHVLVLQYLEPVEELCKLVRLDESIPCRRFEFRYMEKWIIARYQTVSLAPVYRCFRIRQS